MSTHYSEKKNIFPMQGGCACGTIRYSLSLPPLLVHHCHCTTCQLQTGSAFALNAIIESSALQLLPSTMPAPATLSPAFATNTGSVPAATAAAVTAKPEASPVKPCLTCLPTESGVGQVVASCPVCHTALWNHYADAGLLLSYVRVGTLDQAWEIDPDVEIYTRSRRAFVREIGEGTPQFEKYYPDRMALLRDDAKKRVEAMKDKVEGWRVEFRAAMKGK